MAARADPSVDARARLDGTLHVRNPSSEPVELVGQVPAGFEFDWTILGTDGVLWRPDGISGFSRPGDDKRYRVLPVGKYTVRVGGLRFQGMPPLQSSLAEFEVK